MFDLRCGEENQAQRVFSSDRVTSPTKGAGRVIFTRRMEQRSEWLLVQKLETFYMNTWRFL